MHNVRCPHHYVRGFSEEDVKKIGGDLKSCGRTWRSIRRGNSRSSEHILKGLHGCEDEEVCQINLNSQFTLKQHPKCITVIQTIKAPLHLLYSTFTPVFPHLYILFPLSGFIFTQIILFSFSRIISTVKHGRNYHSYMWLCLSMGTKMPELITVPKSPSVFTPHFLVMCYYCQQRCSMVVNCDETALCSHPSEKKIHLTHSLTKQNTCNELCTDICRLKTETTSAYFLLEH